ncbi:MAG: glycoside hydrolase N-terminal domain-containing protein [Planctomycetia bacterium]|nr:glycoside hydrolase N-terminal domain-containing protein [Planctomycetia bacterium]
MSPTTRWILTIAATLSLLPPGVTALQAADGRTSADAHLKIWYETPARIFNDDGKATAARDEGMPLGNGRIAALAMGNTDVEIVSFNEITLWDGGPKTDGGNYAGGNKKDAYLNLPAIREALFAGNFGKANSLAGGVLGRYEGSQAEYGSYRNMGQFELDFSGSDAYVSGKVPSDYYRELDLTGGVAAMLLQSFQGYIEPLPALPQDWSDGSYTGMKARGNFEVDAQWSAGRLNRLAIRSGSGKVCRLRYPGIAKARVELKGAPISYKALDPWTIEFETEKGSEYIVRDFPAVPAAPKNARAFQEEDGGVAVSWEPVENAARYVVYRRLDDGSDRIRNVRVYAPIATTEKTSYRDTDARPTAEGKYFYQVAAVSKDGAEGDVSFHTPTSPAEGAAQ